jgi:hypothetical protein
MSNLDKLFNRVCISATDFCSLLGISHERFMEEVSQSEVSFGNNADTLITMERAGELIGIPEARIKCRIPKLGEGIYVSLGS